MTKRAREARVGDVYAFELGDGRFGASQVVAQNEERVELVSLDAIWEDLPTIAQASQARPLHQFGKLDRCQVEAHPPWYALFVGNCAPVVKVEGLCLAFGGWGTRAAVPRRESEPTPVGLTPEITLDVGGGPWVEHQGAWRVSLNPQRTGRGAVRWRELDRLPDLEEISYEGKDPGLIAYLQQRSITTLNWHGDHGQSRLALEGTSLASISIGTAGLHELLLPASVGLLYLYGEGGPRVHAAREGHWIRLTVTDQRGHRSLNGLSGLRSLTLRTRRVSFSRLSGYRDLRSLCVYGQFATLEHLGALRELSSLQELSVHDAYVFDADDLPQAQELPNLEHVVFDGFPRDAKGTIEKRLAGVPRLELRRPRSVAWVEENRSNPFREWADDDERLGKAATAAWKKARAAVRQLGPKAKRTDARKVLETFVVVFNRFEIDTDRREEACDTFHNLARGLGVPEDRAQDWLDEWRDF
jgi:hypothetical protein